jgi:hypothetical protein
MKHLSGQINIFVGGCWNWPCRNDGCDWVGDGRASEYESTFMMNDADARRQTPGLATPMSACSPPLLVFRCGSDVTQSVVQFMSLSVIPPLKLYVTAMVIGSPLGTNSILFIGQWVICLLSQRYTVMTTVVRYVRSFFCYVIVHHYCWLVWMEKLSVLVYRRMGIISFDKQYGWLSYFPALRTFSHHLVVDRSLYYNFITYRSLHKINVVMSCSKVKFSTRGFQQHFSEIYRVDKKNVSKFQLRYLRKYALILAEIYHCNITSCCLHSL